MLTYCNCSLETYSTKRYKTLKHFLNFLNHPSKSYHFHVGYSLHKSGSRDLEDFASEPPEKYLFCTLWCLQHSFEHFFRRGFTERFRILTAKKCANYTT
jgi:hypothetical protein